MLVGGVVRLAVLELVEALMGMAKGVGVLELLVLVFLCVEALFAVGTSLRLYLSVCENLLLLSASWYSTLCLLKSDSDDEILDSLLLTASGTFFIT